MAGGLRTCAEATIRIAGNVKCVNCCMKHNALSARHTLNEDVEMQKLVQLYHNLLEKDRYV